MKQLESDRVGKIIKPAMGYESFIPHSLYPDGPRNLKIDDECLVLLSEATLALGELKGITDFLPDPDLFIAFYVKKEALLSSQIEGTQCSLDEVLKVDEKTSEVKPVHEVVNYINAMNFGLESLEKMPLSIRLINEIHLKLMDDVRGKEKNPGNFKKDKNWIGPAGCKPEEAYYVPPPPDMMNELMRDFENYYHLEKKLPTLIEASLLHAHFETIHPYSDGNGRLGRLLITFMLCQRRVLTKPLLYLSLFFKEHKAEYYSQLMDVRFLGTWENWIKFFLRGVRNTSNEATSTAREILAIQERHRKQIRQELPSYSLAIPCYEQLCHTPLISIPTMAKYLDASYPGVKAVFDRFLQLRIIFLTEEKKKNKLFRYDEYLDILKRGT